MGNKMRGMEKVLDAVEKTLERIPDASNYPAVTEREMYTDEFIWMRMITANADAKPKNSEKTVNGSVYFYRWLKSKSIHAKVAIWQALEARGWQITFQELLDQIENESMGDELVNAIDHIADEGDLDE